MERSRLSHGPTPQAWHYTAHSGSAMRNDFTTDATDRTSTGSSSAAYQPRPDLRRSQQFRMDYQHAQQGWSNLLGSRPTLMDLADQFKKTEKMPCRHDIKAMDKVLHQLANRFSDILSDSPAFQRQGKPWNANLGKILHGCMQFNSRQTGPGHTGLEHFLCTVADEIARPDAPQLSPQSIGNALYGMKNLVSSQGTEAVLHAIASHIPDSEQLSAQAIGNALYGMKNLVSSQGTEAVLHAITSHITKAEHLDPQAIGNALYGLQNMTPSQGTEAVLHAIALHIIKAEQLFAQEIGNALYGLQNMTSSQGTETILHAITSHITKAEHLDPQAIGNALYGLQNMTPSQDTEAVLHAITSHITKAEQLSSQNIGNALYGLQNMTPSQGTEAVLHAITSHITKAEYLDAQAIGNALYGLQNMTPSQGTEAVLHAIASPIPDSEQLSPQNIGNALYGLQNMTPSQGTEAVLHAIALHITKAEQLSSQEIGNALYGLQNMTSSQGTEAVLHAITSHITKAEYLDPQAIGNALYGLQNMTPSQGTEAVLHAIALHITKAEQLSPQAIVNTLYGLKRFKDSPAASRILCELAAHLSTLTTSQIADFEKPYRFRAEALNSLLPWLHTPPRSASCQAALDLLYALETHFPGDSYAKTLLKQSADRSPFFNPAEMKTMLFQLLQEQVKQKADGDVHDFHGLSHDLARTFGQTTLDRFMTDDSRQAMRLVFGSGTHNPANKEKMKAVARQVTTIPGISLQWKGSSVKVTRIALAQNR